MSSSDVYCGEALCPVEATLDVLEGKWTILIVRDLLAGTKRFAELRRSLTGISPKTLTDRLRALETRGFVTRETFAEVPPRVEYTLTDSGRTLEPVIAALAVWGRDFGVLAGVVDPDHSETPAATASG
ncbi:winged helix-turn-helix transcriptional regulator [Nocardia sp. NPDC127579]|uniref:winged helix-turn-helix transcriptional regulator n=1 Tax=Nocardia sp. NPDC127579 TaxID=3345402 RepID=UPI00362B3371